MSQFQGAGRSALIALSLLALAAAPASATALKGDYLVVDTQGTGTSTIVEAGGAFAGCTAVTDLVNNQEFVAPKTYFTGDKLISCPDGELVIHYAVVLANKKTHGTWFVVDSTIPGITEGFGSLDGNALRCAPAPGAEFCILDTFVGTLG